MSDRRCRWRVAYEGDPELISRSIAQRWGLAVSAMPDGWFYTEGGKPKGPLSIDALIATLRRLQNPPNVLVWNTGCRTWRPAKDVPEIADLAFRPPPIVIHDSPHTAQVVAGHPTEALAAKQSNHRGQWAFWLVLFVVVCVGAYLSDNIYGNSAVGIASLFGEFIGAAIGFGLIAIVCGARRATYTPAVVLAVAALVVVNAPRLREGLDARGGMKALRERPGQIDQVAIDKPSNTSLQLISGINKIGQQTNVAMAALFDRIEPSGLSRKVNYATLTRGEMKTYLRDLKLAEEKALTGRWALAGVYKNERDQMEELARSLNVSDGVRLNLLEGIDKRQRRFLDFNSKMMAAREELYRALRSYITVLDEQYGKYTIHAGGELLFTDQSAPERLNAAVNSILIATKKVSDIDAEGRQLQEFQKEGWERFVNGQ